MSALEHSEVQWGLTHIPYFIQRSTRRGTVGIAVEPSGRVVLTAPETAPIVRLNSIVRQKAKWIVDTQRRTEARPAPHAREFVSGETFRYVGRQYRLTVVPGLSPRPLLLRAGQLELPVDSTLPLEARPAYARAALIDWYIARARAQLPLWITPWATALNVKFDKLLIADQAKRWGSCVSKTLRFNWRIVQAPRALIDYVLAHELVHLTHERHDAAFWSTLGRAMPDYELRKAQLAKLGPELSW
jgi:predicted metal-dependent hydrolase